MVEFLVLLVDLHAAPDVAEVLLAEASLGGDGEVGGCCTEGQVPQRMGTQQPHSLLALWVSDLPELQQHQRPDLVVLGSALLLQSKDVPLSPFLGWHL